MSTPTNPSLATTLASLLDPILLEGVVVTGDAAGTQGTSARKSWQPGLGQVCVGAGASVTQLVELARGHWGIENEVHWVTDVVFGEDACRVRTKDGPQILSGLRNAALSLLHGTGLNQIASALRHLAAFPLKAIQLVTQGQITDL